MHQAKAEPTQSPSYVTKRSKKRHMPGHRNMHTHTHQFITFTFTPCQPVPELLHPVARVYCLRNSLHVMSTVVSWEVSHAWANATLPQAAAEESRRPNASGEVGGREETGEVSTAARCSFTV